MKLNTDKYHLIVSGTKHEHLKVKTCKVGVNMDIELIFGEHASNTCLQVKISKNKYS